MCRQEHKWKIALYCQRIIFNRNYEIISKGHNLWNYTLLFTFNDLLLTEVRLNFNCYLLLPNTSYCYMLRVRLIWVKWTHSNNFQKGLTSFTEVKTNLSLKQYTVTLCGITELIFKRMCYLIWGTQVEIVVLVFLKSNSVKPTY